MVWEAPAFNVTPSFDIVLVNSKVADNGLIGCIVPERLHEKAKAVAPGDAILCAGEVGDFESMLGAAIINVTADDFVAGQSSIAAWKAAQKK